MRAPLLAVAVAVAAAALVVLAPVAPAFSSRAPEPAADPVASAIAAALPPELALVSVEPPPSLRRARGVRFAVEWPIAPRAGAATALVTARRPSGAVVARAWVVARLAPIREVPVAARALESGATLEPADVLVVRRAAVEGEPLGLDALVGARLLTALPAGATITAAAIARRPPLPRGAALTVRVRAGEVVVTAPGVLEQAARPGDVATIRLTGASARLVSGRLVDERTAEIGVVR
jgi:flagella basal body P-ring formation protein FlgA